MGSTLLSTIKTSQVVASDCPDFFARYAVCLCTFSATAAATLPPLTPSGPTLLYRILGISFSDASNVVSLYTKHGVN